MSRFAVTAVYEGFIDQSAIVGWDPGLATYFLQAFRSNGEVGLRLGGDYGEFPTPDALARRCALLGISLSRVSGGAPEDQHAGAELNEIFTSIFSRPGTRRYNSTAAPSRA